MGNSTLIELRSAIAAFSKGINRLDNDDIFASFEAQHGKLLADASRDLHRLAFIKLLNDVSRRQMRITSNSNQPDLFGNIKHPKLIPIPIYKDGKLVGREKVDFDRASIADVQSWRALKKAPRKGRPTIDDGIDEMLALILEHTDDTSISIADALKIVQHKSGLL